MLDRSQVAPCSNHKRGRILTLAAVFAAILSSQPTPGITAQPRAVASPPRVVVTIKPLHSLAAGVMHGIGEPYLIIKGASSPHTYAMKPTDAAALQQAHIVFWIGPDFETFLSSSIRKLASKAKIRGLREAPGIKQRFFRQGPGWGGHADDHAHDKTKNAPNPHIWLDPANGQAIANEIARTLSDADPRNKARYRKNAQQIIKRLQNVERELADMLKAVRTRPYLVFHDAYQHFEDRFGIPAAGSISLGDARAPGARRLRALSEKIAKLGVGCIFSEPQFQPRIVRSLLAGSSTRAGIMDPLGAQLKPGPELYVELLRNNANAMVNCLMGKPR